MAKKFWMILGLAMLALWGAAPANAGFAIDNSVMLDPYDPVPPIQFSHWYQGYGCYDECGHHCWHSCYRHVNCYEDCYRGDCDDGCYRSHCYHDCYRHDCYSDCNAGYAPPPVRIVAPCTTGDCYESERYEHKFRDGSHVTKEWVNKGRREGDMRGYRDDDDSYEDGPPVPPPPPPPPVVIH